MNKTKTKSNFNLTRKNYMLQIAHIKLLREAATTALAHIQELREAWMTGVIHETDGLGGIRSNRNVDVEYDLRTALKETE